MKLITILTIVLAAIFAPIAAHADEPLPPLTYDEVQGQILDCDAGVWWVDVAHYRAEQLEPGVYAERTETFTTEVLAPAAGDECPAVANLSAPVEDVADATPATYAPAEPVVDVTVWKLGIFG